MDFPLSDLLDPQRCYDFLVPLLQPEGLRCPRGCRFEDAYVHKRDCAPVLDYRCRACGHCFNTFTGTVLQGTKLSVVQIVQLLRGIALGTATAQLAREMETDRRWLLVRRHQLQSLACQARSKTPWPDRVVEADEMYQNAGGKRAVARQPRRSATTSWQ